MDDDEEDTEAELARTRFRVREHQRRAALAKFVAVGLTLGGFVLGLVLQAYASQLPFFDRAPLFRGRLLWVGLFAGGFLGAAAWRRLEPTDSIDDL